MHAALGWSTTKTFSIEAHGVASFSTQSEEPRGGGWDPVKLNNGWSAGGGHPRISGGGRACFKCNEEGHISRDYPKAGAGRGGNRVCFKCNQEGHISKECPNISTGSEGSRTCHTCGAEGHKSRECPQGGGSRDCYTCGGEGHISRECPQGGASRVCHKRKEIGHIARECPTGGGTACFNCGQEGHMLRDCPTAPVRDGTPRSCAKCHSMEHQTRECTLPYSDVDADGKPRELYTPMAATDDELFATGIATGSNFVNFDKVALKIMGNDVPLQFITSFESAGLRPSLLENIKKSGYTKPTPIQRGSFSVILARRDLVASAVTGSGKTAAYLIPVINNLLEQGVTGGSPGGIQTPDVVILAPTRELAIQIQNESRKFALHSVIRSVVIYGGTVVAHQLADLQQGCNILVATPGRLSHFVANHYLDFSKLQFLVLDEADRMLEDGIGLTIEALSRHPTMPPPGKRQTLMFSATFPDEVQRLIATYLNDYIFLTTGMVGGTNPDVCQEFLEVPRSEKRDKMEEILNNVGKAKTIVFVESKKTADFLATRLCNTGFLCTSIHGDRLQSQRELALDDLRRGNRNVLVTTNVCARGIDVAGVEYVINYDLPHDIEAYVHRIGRTGRVGNVGKSISFYDPDRDRDKVPKLVEKLVLSNADIPSFLQSAMSQTGMSGMGYNFNAPSSQLQSGFTSRDVRRFGNGAGVGLMEQEESWD